MVAHCLFEQSGCFKNEFKKLGIEAYDYDIENQFNETDYQIDLFNEIEKAYRGEYSIFDNIKQDDIILAFFPCTMFQENNFLFFTGNAWQLKNKTDNEKLEYVIKRHETLSKFYILLSKLVVIIIKNKLRLIFENPYSQPNYLNLFWCIKPTIIDKNRLNNGDYYKKPTQYWFINCEPKNNYVNDKLEKVQQKIIQKITGLSDNERQVKRSMIHPQYARRFIKRYIIDYDSKTEENPSDTKTLFDYIKGEE